MRVTRRTWLRFFVFLSLIVVGSCDEEIKWTPNDDAANAPLPLSMNQRQQLLQLDQAIRSSPDPNGTLQKVAEQNGMSPQDLVNMLDKNNRDLAQNPSLLRPTTFVSVISKAVATVGLVLSQAAKRNPRSFALSATLLLFLLYATIMIPRTGLHITKGTALFPPSQQYLQKLADSPALERRSLSILHPKTQWDDLPTMEQDGVEIHKLPKSSELTQAISAQFTLFPEEFFEAAGEEELDEEEDAKVKEDVLDLLFENAAYVVTERQWTEFTPSDHPLKLAGSGMKRGVLMVPGLGVMGRCGIVRYQITQQVETDNVASVTVATLKGDFFDGQLHLEARKVEKGSKVVLVAHLGVPRRGRKMNKTVAKRVVSALVESMGTSTSQRVRQTLARRSIGKRFKVASSQRASERRRSRFDREKLIEDMSEERRRKWQRGNPNAGRWTPTGDRMRSPGGGPSRGW